MNNVQKQIQRVAPKQDEKLKNELLPKKLYTCDYCQKSFTSKYDVSRHIRIHTNDRPYKCSVCGSAFRVKTHLSVHELIHTKQKSVICDICRRGFKTKSELVRHLQCHKKTKPIICETCGSRFAYKSSLYAHRRIHNGKKEFECRHCGRQFVQKAQLQTHVKTHNVKPYSCIHCSRCFRSEVLLKRHLLVHAKPMNFVDKGSSRSHEKKHEDSKEFTCFYCNKSFSRKHTLVSHIYIHLNIKPFQCKYCKCKFRVHSHLNDHIKLHLPEKPYKCDLCDKQYAVKKTLVQHARTHEKSKVLHCKLCNASFRKLSAKMLHMLKHEPAKSERTSLKAPCENRSAYKKLKISGQKGESKEKKCKKVCYTGIFPLHKNGKDQLANKLKLQMHKGSMCVNLKLFLNRSFNCVYCRTEFENIFHLIEHMKLCSIRSQSGKAVQSSSTPSRKVIEKISDDVMAQRNTVIPTGTEQNSVTVDNLIITTKSSASQTNEISFASPSEEQMLYDWTQLPTTTCSTILSDNYETFDSLVQGICENLSSPTEYGSSNSTACYREMLNICNAVKCNNHLSPGNKDAKVGSHDRTLFSCPKCSLQFYDILNLLVHDITACSTVPLQEEQPIVPMSNTVAQVEGNALDFNEEPIEAFNLNSFQTLNTDIFSVLDSIPEVIHCSNHNQNHQCLNGATLGYLLNNHFTDDELSLNN